MIAPNPSFRLLAPPTDAPAPNGEQVPKQPAQQAIGAGKVPIRSYRRGGQTLRERQAKFLAAFKISRGLKDACAATGLSRTQVWSWRRRDPKFAKAYERAKPVRRRKGTPWKPGRRPPRLVEMVDVPGVAEWVPLSIQGTVAVLPLSCGKRALVSLADWRKVGRRLWHTSHKKTADTVRYYARRHLPGGGFEVLARLLSGAGPDEVVWFRDGDTLNCTRANLQLLTNQPKTQTPAETPAEEQPK